VSQKISRAVGVLRTAEVHEVESAPPRSRPEQLEKCVGVVGMASYLSGWVPSGPP
jgi:hypothetical protein